MTDTHVQLATTGEPGRPNPRNRAASILADMCEQLIARFRESRAPLPVVVIQAPASTSGPADEAGALVRNLHQAYAGKRVSCKLLALSNRANGPVGPTHCAPQPEVAELRRASKLVARLASEDWDQSDPQYRHYSFPRWTMLEAMEVAVDREITRALGEGKGDTQASAATEAEGEGDAEAHIEGDAQTGTRSQEDPTEPSASKAVAGLRRLQWRPPRTTTRPVGRVFAPLLAPAPLLGAFATASVTRVLTQAPPSVLAGVLLVVLVLLTGVQILRQNLAPLSWLGQASRWLTTTTHLAPTDLGPEHQEAANKPWWAWSRWAPRSSRQIMEARARMIAEQMIAAGAGDLDPGVQRRALQFLLTLRVHAMLEDLRAEHRPWALDLRGRKRTVPPMVFIVNANQFNGGRAFLYAISDVRSRRSETDPLLVVASVPSDTDLTGIQELQRAAGAECDSKGLYEDWANRLRIEQSPSFGSDLPWVMRLPLTAQDFTASGRKVPLTRARPTGWALWSRWTLAVALVLLAGTAWMRNSQLAAQYCGGGLISSDHDLVWKGNECVGVDTRDSFDFSTANDIRLNATSQGTASALKMGGDVSLHDVIAGIWQQNQAADTDPAHVTIVYAGPLTVPTGTDSSKALDAAKELAGVYAWQRYENITGQGPKTRIDIANGGNAMAHQIDMARAIVDVARHDPSVVGVIGMGRDTDETETAVQILGQADIPVVDTTNSSDVLHREWNYLGLAATNHEEATALAAVVAAMPAARGGSIAVLERPNDRYSKQQADDAVTAFRKLHMTIVGGGPLTFETTAQSSVFVGGQNSPRANICDSARRPAFVYLAGRSDDLAGLNLLLSSYGKCFASPVTVLSGDDLTKSELVGQTDVLPGSVTLYYAALTDPARSASAAGTAAGRAIAAVLKLAPPVNFADPFFADGTVVLGYDAADALQQAAAQETSSGGARIFALRCLPNSLTSTATGTISFNPNHHAVAIIQVTGKQASVFKYNPATLLACNE
ncbi:hypothetical protein ABUW04_33280 [Streptacidiphilus sp. N1-10]|uniref:ABC transporter substrate-binding protein n=1 Tax=Streptacidiphilus jeojiensis TaxID=3229225 RepID=A0ABV6XXZ9_9ACTN